MLKICKEAPKKRRPLLAGFAASLTKIEPRHRRFTMSHMRWYPFGKPPPPALLLHHRLRYAFELNRKLERRLGAESFRLSSTQALLFDHSLNPRQHLR